MKNKSSTIRKAGITLIEVSFASVILGIITGVGPICFMNAARVRMDARGHQAALIEANSLLEQAFAASDREVYNQGSGFFNRDMELSATDPAVKWAFDDELLSVQINFTAMSNQLAFISVSVDTAQSRPVVLSMYRYCER